MTQLILRGKTMGSHQSASMKSDAWLTPPEILDDLGPFDLDPCAAPEPRPWPTAKHHISLPEDGLRADWAGRIWLNPPYSREAVKWLAKLASAGSGTALVFARTETSWFVETIWKNATAILFIHGRITFYRQDGTKASANSGAPSALVAYGEYDAYRLRVSKISGTYTEWR